MLKIFLMTKNETALIEDWIKYHGYLFGLENIHVFDGSDDKEVLDIYARYIPLGLKVHYSPANLNDACDELNSLMHQYKGEDNFLIKLDTDEFIACTEPFNLQAHSRLDRFFRKGSLITREKTGRFRRLLSEKVMDFRCANKVLLTDNINDRLEKLPVTGKKYKAALTVWSLPTQEASHRPCRELTRFTAIQYTQVKSFFHSSSFVSVDLGCHRGVTTDNSGEIDTGLTIVHYHSTSVEDSVRRARQALLSHGYISESDDIRTQKEKLMRLISSAEANSFHKMEFYIKHLDFLNHGSPVAPSTLNLYHPHFRSSGAEREVTIIRDTLEQIDASGRFCS